MKVPRVILLLLLGASAEATSMRRHRFHHQLLSLDNKLDSIDLAASIAASKESEKLRNRDEYHSILLKTDANSHTQVGKNEDLSEVDTDLSELAQDLQKQNEIKEKKVAVKEKEVLPPVKPSKTETKQISKAQKELIGKDDIGAATNEDMYAFSQVIAAGGNVVKTIKSMEKENQKQILTEKQQRDQEMLKSYMVSQITPEDKVKMAKQKKQHSEAMERLKELENNDATQALAALQAAQEVEVAAENMRGSGEDPEEERRKMLAQQEKDRKEFLKKQKEQKRQESIKKVQDKLKLIKKKKAIEQAYENLKKQHGGLTGTEDTGYDDDAMSSYIKQDVAALMLEESFEPEQYMSMLREHRSHILLTSMDD